MRLRQPNPAPGGERGRVVLVPRPRVERVVGPAGAVRGEDATRVGPVRAPAAGHAFHHRVRRQRGEHGGGAVDARGEQGVRRGPVRVTTDAHVPPREVPAIRPAHRPRAHAPDGRASHGPVVDTRHPRSGALASRGSAHRVCPSHAEGRSEVILGCWRAPRADDEEHQQRREAPGAPHSALTLVGSGANIQLFLGPARLVNAEHFKRARQPAAAR